MTAHCSSGHLRARSTFYNLLTTVGLVSKLPELNGKSRKYPGQVPLSTTAGSKELPRSDGKADTILGPRTEKVSQFQGRE